MGGGVKSYSVSPTDYKLLEEVGYGASATVFRAIYLPFNEVVAVKCLDLDRCNSNLILVFLLFLRLKSGHFLNQLAELDWKISPINCGYINGSLRTFNLSSLEETLPAAVLQTARVLARKEVLTYNLPLDTLGDYYIILYFAGILPVSPSFNMLINGDVVQSNYTVKSSEVSALFKSLNITMKSISFYPQINAIEVYEIVDIPSESSSTTVLALQVIQQSTGLDLG